MKHLPAFNEDGLLPAGDYAMSMEEVLESSLVVAETDAGDWDGAWRERLVRNLDVMVHHLWQVGIHEIFVDGSFVENKPHPNDIDGYFLCEASTLFSGDLEARLQKFDDIWTWDPARRYASPDSAERQLPMWHKYRVELFPHVGQWTGIVDAFGNELTFPSAFRQSREFKPKGIVKIGGLS
jgi:hypothetical protein